MLFFTKRSVRSRAPKTEQEKRRYFKPIVEQLEDRTLPSLTHLARAHR